MRLRFIKGLSDIDEADWESLRGCDYPFLSYSFLNALEASGCVGEGTGWTAMHLIGEKKGQLCFALPLYIKSDSYGEYVFDWQWANAFESQGRRYFPKLLTAIPFTPATGPRLLYKSNLSEGVEDEFSLSKNELGAILDHISDFARKNALSSWHILFPNDQLNRHLDDRDDMLERNDVQFHWHNAGYQQFDDFLAPFRSSKRKQIRRERRKVAEQGIRLERKTGAALNTEDWQRFYQCYQSTYLKRSGHSGYLNREFFEQIAKHMSEQVMIVFAHQNDRVIASSLFFFDSETLYGRYWGELASADCLHFEACYYQGIEFAIKKGLKHFNPGTQGEHKLVRGFEPTTTRSYHWIADPDFAQAIANYLKQERHGIQSYKNASENYLPFRRDTG